MTAYSLRARLLALWVLLLTSAAATAYLMYGVYNQSTGVQVAQTEIAVAREADMPGFEAYARELRTSVYRAFH